MGSQHFGTPAYRPPTTQAKRAALAEKIALAVVDKISNEIIRPGPVAEERECYVMAQELRDAQSSLRDLIAEIIKQETV